MSELLAIGRFARLAGLSVGALRHYNELGLLVPAFVDDATSYRYYRPEQVATARLIGRLRDLEMPLPEIQAFLAADPGERRRRLALHRRRIEARTWRLQGALHQLSAMNVEESSVTEPTTESSDRQFHRSLGVELFNRVWGLLEVDSRTPEQDDELVHAAHASRYHWSQSGDEQMAMRLAVGEWQCSRVYAALGRAEPALHHARRALEIAESEPVPSWVRASAHEAMARALYVAGRPAEAGTHAATAEQLVQTIDDEDDREVIRNDLATLPRSMP